MDNKILDQLIETVKEKNLGVQHVVVRQGGDIIAQHDFDKVERRLLYSVSKTFTAMAVGIALDEGLISLSDKVAGYFPDMNKPAMNEHMEAMTIHDLLCMGTGQEECPVMKHDWSKNEKVDIAELFFAEPVVHEPGTHFVYNNGATYMLSRIIEKVSGKKLRDYFDKRLFKPLGIPKPRWKTCPMGHTMGFSGLHLTAEELSRFGQLLLNQGMWEGKQLIPADYIAKATSKQIATDNLDEDFATEDHHSGYGYQLWMNSYPDSYRLDGLYGQYVVVLPKKDAVVTYQSYEERNMVGVLELTWDTLVDKL